MVTAHHHSTGVRISGNFDLNKLASQAPQQKVLENKQALLAKLFILTAPLSTYLFQTANRFDDYSTNLLFRYC
jgi:hypothetical protein